MPVSQVKRRLALLPALAGLVFSMQGGLAVAASHWQALDVQDFYLHQPPGSFTGLYRSQGIATDGQQWFFSWQYGLERADQNFVSVQRNSNMSLSGQLTPGIPAQLLARGLNHIGDIDVSAGKLYVPLDSTAKGYTTPYVAVFNAADLSYSGQLFSLAGTAANPNKDLASWVAVDAAQGYGYAKEWASGNTLNVYHLNDWSFSHTLTLDSTLGRIQGAKVVGDSIYLASDNATRSVYRASLLDGHVEELFQLPQPAGDLEVEGIALRRAQNGALDMYVEMIVDPDHSRQSLSNPNLHVSLFHYQLAAVPEPQSWALMLAGLALVGRLSRVRRPGQAIVR